MKYLGTTFFPHSGGSTVLGQAEDGSLWQLNIFNDGACTAGSGCQCCSHPQLVKELEEQGIRFASADSRQDPASPEWQSLRKEHDENPKLYTFKG